MSYTERKAQARYQYDHKINECLHFYGLKNNQRYMFFMKPSIKIKLVYSIYYCYVILSIFCTKILFEDFLHCIVFLNE